MKRILAALILLCAMLNIAYAWDAIGHRVVAQIAEDNLNSCSRAEVQALFAALPAQYPQHLNLVTAADWLDNDNSTCPYDSTHCLPPPKSWHFIQRPYSIGSAAPSSANPIAAPNIVWAIQQELAYLNNPKATQAQQAIALLILDHLLGDVSQPLHNENGYDRTFPLPAGDHGGNAYAIHADILCYSRHGHPYPQEINNLHRYWDEGAGLFTCQSARHGWAGPVDRFAQQQEAAYQDNPALRRLIQTELTETDPSAWSLQAYHYVPEVYGVAYQGEPSHAYQTWAESLVRQQLALSGYRLAQVLNQAFIQNGRCH